MQVAGEEQNLPVLFGELAERVDGRLGAELVEIHQHVVEDHRQVDAFLSQLVHGRHADGQEKLLARAAAELLDGERLAPLVVDAEFPLAERRPDVAVAAAGQLLEVF